jgi:hypothetical protein
MKIIASYALLSGVVAAVYFVLLIVWRASTFSIAEVGFWGVTCIPFGIGVLKRKKFAWLLGIGLLVASLVSFWREAIPMVLQEAPGSRRFLVPLVLLMGLFVISGLEFIWYTQRRYFTEDQE